MVRDYRRSVDDVYLSALQSGTFDLEFAKLHAQQIEIRKIGLALHNAMRERFGKRDADLVTHEFDEHGEVLKTPRDLMKKEIEEKLQKLVSGKFVLDSTAASEEIEEDEAWWKVVSASRLREITQELRGSVGDSLLQQCEMWNDRVRAETVQQIQKY